MLSLDGGYKQQQCPVVFNTVNRRATQARHSGIPFRFGWVLLVMASHGVASGVVLAAGPSMEEIRQQWKLRQESIRSANIRWRESQFIRAKSLFNPLGGMDDSDRIPDKDLTLDRDVQLQIDFANMRYEYRGQSFEAVQEAVRLKHYVSVFDGETAVNYHDLIERSDSDEFPRTGFMRRESLHYDHGNYLLRSMVMFLRPCDSSMGGVDLRGYEIGDGPEDIDGRRCLVLRPKRGASSTQNWETVYWVDPERDYVVLRIIVGRRGAPPQYSIDIEYEPSEPMAWFPMRWRIVRTNGSTTNVYEEISAEVGTVSINVPVEEDVFQMGFPPNSAVVDNRMGERFMSRLDGQKRRVLPEELRRGATYAELIRTEEGEAMGNVPDSRAQWIFAGYCGLGHRNKGSSPRLSDLVWMIGRVSSGFV